MTCSSTRPSTGCRETDPALGDDAGSVVDARRPERLLGYPQPAACADDSRLVLARPLLTDAAVADVDDPVGDLRRRRVVTHEDRRRSDLPDELGQEREDVACSLLVEVAGRLVRDEELRLVRQRGAERDALLLASRELAREGVGTIEQPDPLQELAGSDQRRVGWNGGEPERQGDELRRGELTLERAPVVLVRIPEHVPAIPPELAGGRIRNVDTGNDERARRRPCEAGEDAHKGRLPGPARAEHDTDLALVDPQREPLQGGDSACGGRVDGEQFAGVDKRGHSVGLPVRGAPFTCERATRRAADEESRRRLRRARLPRRRAPDRRPRRAAARHPLRLQ